MKALITADQYFVRTPDGTVYVPSIYGYDFWKHYLQVFDQLKVVARIRDETLPPTDMIVSSGPGVEFFGFDYGSRYEFMKIRRKFKELADECFDGCDCAILRIPSMSSYLIYKQCVKKRLPHTVYVVIDPWEVFISKSVRSFILRCLFAWNTKRACKTANGVAYVTQSHLQKRYPSKARCCGEDSMYFETFYSDAILPDDWYGEKRVYRNKTGPFIIVHTANYISGHIKGHLKLIKALKIIREKNYDVEIVFIGDGPSRKSFEAFAHNEGLGKFVRFTGVLASKWDVRNELLKADMFVFPSLSEGLPRAILEAMAVALPCISSPVGGVPEILDSDFLVNPRNETAIAEKIIQLIDSPQLMEEASAQNLKKAYEFRQDIQTQKEKEFYQKLYRISEKI